MNYEKLVAALPKAELHLHIEGSLEPELMFEMAARNQVPLAFKSIHEIRSAYNFHNLQSFLDIYYAGAQVLQKEIDFYDLTMAYLKRAKADGVLHTEIFFDPQTHTSRGIDFATVIRGIHAALDEGERSLGVSSQLIMCFLRHLSEDEAETTLKMSFPYRDWIAAVGLDSSELGHPPSKFQNVYRVAREEYGYRSVAHAGEEGPPSYIWEALDLLKVERIDHGVRCLEDKFLVERLREEKIPLTVCPLSNIKLKVFSELSRHNLKKLMDAGLIVTINSDDPSYFGGYISDNYLALAKALDLDKKDICQLVQNSWQASFIPEERKKDMIDLVAKVANSELKE